MLANLLKGDDQVVLVALRQGHVGVMAIFKELRFLGTIVVQACWICVCFDLRNEPLAKLQKLMQIQIAWNLKFLNLKLAISVLALKILLLEDFDLGLGIQDCAPLVG
jgi:hypothetical protein